MSDEDRDVDIESGEESDTAGQAPVPQPRSSKSGAYHSQAEKRAHHNALERKRRDHIKNSFIELKETLPAFNGVKVASRAQILKKAAEYVVITDRKLSQEPGVDELKKQNDFLEKQIRVIEKARSKGRVIDVTMLDLGLLMEDSSSEDEGIPLHHTKYNG